MSLVFGDKLSALYALDIETLFKFNVECVRSFGPRRENLGKLENALEQYRSRISYSLAAFSLYTTTTQVCVASLSLVIQHTVCVRLILVAHKRALPAGRSSSQSVSRRRSSGT